MTDNASKEITIDGKTVCVTPNGDVWLNGKSLKQKRYKQWYLYVCIKGKNYLVHRIVAEAFICHLDRGDRSVQVHHKNEIKDDNRVENLEVIGAKEHAALHKQIYPITKKCAVCGKEFTPHPTKRKRAVVCSDECKRIHDYEKARRVTVIQYAFDGSFVKRWRSASDAAKSIGASDSGIIACCRNRIRSCSGFKWKYE